MAKRLLFTFLLIFSFNLIDAQVNEENRVKSPQSEIELAFITAQYEKSDKPLCIVEDSISQNTGGYWTYWNVYCKLYKSYFYATTKQQSKAVEMLDSGIQILEEKGKLTTEDYALLAYVQSQKLRYTTGMESGVLASKSRENALMSVKLDEENLRGWYVLAVIDFYTPKMFGGKEKCEEYLLKAIALPSQSIDNIYLPSWGKVESYSLLLNFYSELHDSIKFKQYYNKAIEEFPDEPTIQSYENRF